MHLPNEQRKKWKNPRAQVWGTQSEYHCLLHTNWLSLLPSSLCTLQSPCLNRFFSFLWACISCLPDSTVSLFAFPVSTTAPSHISDSIQGWWQCWGTGKLFLRLRGAVSIQPPLQIKHMCPTISLLEMLTNNVLFLLMFLNCRRESCHSNVSSDTLPHPLNTVVLQHLHLYLKYRSLVLITTILSNSNQHPTVLPKYEHTLTIMKNWMIFVTHPWSPDKSL